MKKNWESELSRPDFLNRFQNMFEPYSNDLGIALSLQSNLMETKAANQALAKYRDLEVNKGWLNVTDIAKNQLGMRTEEIAHYELQADGTRRAVAASTFTGTMVDAVNIFLNQLVATMFSNLLKKLTGAPTTSPYTGDYGLVNYTAGDTYGGGAKATQDQLKKIIEPNFTVRGDYDILAELTMCPDPTKAGPTNCVITEKFRQAVADRMTVGEAMDQGYLNKDAIFGFTADGLEPKYNEGYPYRSMIILRKFRILPVGWEVAAQYIKDHAANTSVRNLKDLVDCYADNDGREGFSADWCKGMIDPSWVLKAPLNYCKKEGYGPEILSENITGEGSASKLTISRNDNYCADEQSCVKEKADGSCDVYGYCTEEKRKWNFGSNSCEPLYNTCQTFRSREGDTVSYLQNGLDYDNCSADAVGCKEYKLGDAGVNMYDAANNTVKWESSAVTGNFNRNLGDCDANGEGCHQFIRTINNNGINELGGTSTSVIYEKLLPNYLEYVCYVSPGTDYNLSGTAPAICKNFARKCNASEVGCKMFTATIDNMTIPASVTATDYCDASCVGYDEYVQSASAFDSQRSAYIIPANSKTCGAEAVGCDGFTNLDKIGSSTQNEQIDQYGAEAIEYYSELRQCVKNSDLTCTEFYTWEGSSETGFQLKVYQLKADNAGKPAVTNNLPYNGKTCDADTYGDLDNPMCFEYYNKAGDVSYKFSPNTIACSDNCHPYRRTAIDVVGSCKNGGTWSTEQQACIYNTIPGQGKTCSAAQDGCREYNGNSGANVQIVLQSDFEGSTAGWQGVDGATVSPDSESLKMGQNSLKVSGTGISYDVSGIAKQGKSYHLSFLAKRVDNSANKIANIEFNSGATSTAFGIVDNTSDLSADWKLFEFNLPNLDHEITSAEKLIIKTEGNFFIDIIILTEITDRYYLIKDSSVIPDVCSNDVFGNYQGPEYNLGCAEYSVEGEKDKHYLRQFSKLCQESAVGCEMMIDTKNSTSVTDDEIAYAVYSRDKECNIEDKGCERMGEVYQYGGDKLYSDVYKINDPDKPATCEAGQVGCEEWSAEDDNGSASLRYFKNPADMTCEWRQQTGSVNFGWYKKKISRCDANGDKIVGSSDSICRNDKDCNGAVCLLDQGDYSCATELKTIGYGGNANAIYQPSNDWVGVCSASQSTCTEYIDPISNFSANGLFNGTFSQDVDSNNIPDGWSAAVNGEQTAPLEPHTLYIFAVANMTDNATLSINSSNIKLLETSNVLSAGTNSISIQSGTARVSRTFYYDGSEGATAKIQVSNLTPTTGRVVELKKAVLDYQLSKEMNKNDCNGVFNPNNGCVLFNERKNENNSFKALKYDADISVGVPSSGNNNTNDSNVLLKVAPDRACDKWLACKSYVKDENNNNVCYGIGLCNSFDGNGNCNSFIVPKNENQQMVTANAGKYQNMSGYSEVGSENTSFKKDLLSLAAMSQKGGMTLVPNGDFENFNADKYPLGWNPSEGIAWNENLFSVINNPVAAQTEGVKYDGKGKAFLKYSPAAGMMESDFIDVEPSGEYYLSADVNTLNAFTKDGMSFVFAISVRTFDDVGDLSSSAESSAQIGSDFVECDHSAANMPWINGCAAYATGGKDWGQAVTHFKIGSDTHRIKLQLLSWVGKAEVCCDKVAGNGLCGTASTNYYLYSQGGAFPRGVDIGADFFYGFGQSCSANEGTYTVEQMEPDDTCLNQSATDALSITMTKDTCSGSVYLDNIKIKPVLKVRNFYDVIAPTCRLYPESDSLSCEYYEDSGIKKKGRYGYCLEYDRYPGNPNACLLWYPVDRVRGDWEENVSGYHGKTPVLYSMEGEAKRTYEYRHAYSTGTGCECTPTPACNPHYTGVRVFKDMDCGSDCGGWNEAEEFYFYCRPDNSNNLAIKLDGSNLSAVPNHDVRSPEDGWYPYTGVHPFARSVLIHAEHPYVKHLCPAGATSCRLGSELFRSRVDITQIAKTVSNTGQNKYWSARVFEGSAYETIANRFVYNDVGAPFGSITFNGEVSGAFTNNPSEWDGNTAIDGVQQVTTAISTKNVNTNKVYGCIDIEQNNCAYLFNSKSSDFPYSYYGLRVGNFDNSAEEVKRIFAKSYGVWRWDNALSQYVADRGVDWSPPKSQCPATGRPEYSTSSPDADYCAIPPRVENIKINNATGNVVIEGHGIANLTFNSIIDSQQMPLLMYVVDWMDGNSDTVSGIEMMPKSSLDNPHSLYYLYDYWDLKATSTSNNSTVDCYSANTPINGTTPTANYCVIKPRVKINDNWGWISGSGGGYNSYSGLIIVTEE